jgi:hypothetical protein
MSGDINCYGYMIFELGNKKTGTPVGTTRHSVKPHKPAVIPASPYLGRRLSCPPSRKFH